MLQGLDPVMSTIVHDLRKVSDFRNMRVMNAKWDHHNSHKYGKIDGADSDHHHHHHKKHTQD